jgi:acetyl-CoA carboxylase biotin carboxyl carrier protein
MSLRSVTAETQGTVLTIDVSRGERIEVAQILLRLEIMKMEIPVEAPAAGCVTSIHVKAGEYVAQGDLLVTIDTQVVAR